MKLIITKYTDRLKLIKFFRCIRGAYNTSLSDAVYYVNHLPYVFDGISKFYAEEIQKKIKDCALFSIEENELNEDKFCNYNLNINPPQEYIDAIAWYETCCEEHKQYIDQIVLWKNKPAVC